MKGSLLVIAGIDGSGKSTQTRRLYEWCVRGAAVNSVMLEQLITDNRHDKKSLRESINYIKQSGESFTETEMDFIKSIFHIRNRLEYLAAQVDEGKIVIVDRYVESVYGHSRLYQVSDRLIESIIRVEDYIPDAYMLLDVPPLEAHRRLTCRARSIKAHETLESLVKMSMEYKKIVLNLGGCLIDGSKAEDEVFTAICEVAGKGMVKSGAAGV
jgi:thymidylate kinase